MITDKLNTFMTMIMPSTQVVNSVTVNKNNVQEFVEHKTIEYPNGQVVHDTVTVSLKTLGANVDILV